MGYQWYIDEGSGILMGFNGVLMGYSWVLMLD